MRMSFRLSIIGLACVLCLLVLQTSSEAGTITWKLGHTGAPNSIYDVVSYKFAERVEANTGGKIKIKVFGNSQLGNIPQLWGLVKTGLVDVFMTEPVLSLIPEPKPKNFMVIITPYLFETQADYRKFIGSTLFREMMSKVENSGNMKFIGYLGDRPPRALTTTNRGVEKIEDLKGLKIRTASLPPAVEMWKQWGASPTPVAPAEMYTSLKSGLVEGQENPILYARDAKFYEVQKYFIAIDYIRSGHGAWINQQRWDSISDELKGAVIKATEETTVYIDKYAVEQIGIAERELMENGMIVIHPDLTPFKESAHEWAMQNDDGRLWEKGLYGKIRAIFK